MSTYHRARFPSLHARALTVGLTTALALTATCGHAADDIVIADFEGDTYGAWTTTGEAFGTGPARGALPNQQQVHGFIGKGLVNSYHHGDGTTGTLTSPAFTLERPYLTFLIGGGKDEEKLSMTLLIDGKVVRRATGVNDDAGGKEDPEAGWWDVSEFKGKSAIIHIIDQATGGWGHLTVDQLVQSERKPAALLTKATRTFTIEKRYLHLPIKNGSPHHKVTTLVDGQAIVQNDIELADGTPDWWAFIDVGAYQGKSVTIQVDKLTETSTALSALTQSDAIPGVEKLYRETIRGQFHFSSRVGWLNDPNGLVFFNGEYHLFYQHNPYGFNWGNMHWGHAVSKDLVRWVDLGDVLAPDEFGPMFSGSALVDWKNTSGLGTTEHPPLVLIYTAAGKSVQCLASSTDGRTFTKYSGNPAVKTITGGNRDPKVMWHEPTKRWVMVLYVGISKKHTVHILTSPNLREWTVASIVEGGTEGSSSYLYECPDFFALPVDGQTSNQQWVLIGADDQYATGTFDGITFTPQQSHLRANHGHGFYAAQSYSDIPAADGRRIQIGWLQAPTPGMPFNQCMTIPQELKLMTTPDGVRLTRTPVKELESLRVKSQRSEAATLTPDSANPLAAISAELVELRADLIPGDAKEITFLLRGANIIYDVAKQELRVNDLRTPAPLRDGHLRLTVYIDRNATEVFACDGLVYVPLPFIPKADDHTLSVKSVGGSVKISELIVHELETSWK